MIKTTNKCSHEVKQTHLQKLDKLLEVHIFMRKKGRKNKQYSPEFKISVIMDMELSRKVQSKIP